MIYFKKKNKTKTQIDWLVIGLGNPGPKYEGTRHNAGAEVIEDLVAKSGVSLKNSKYRARTSSIQLAGKKVVFAVPSTFMNLSGEAVRKLTDIYQIPDSGNLLIIHDELDLEPGVIKLKKGGGLAGHNGLKSIAQHLKTKDFLRLKIGIGRPEHGNISSHVLGRPTKADARELQLAARLAIDTVELVITEGLNAAMNQTNRK